MRLQSACLLVQTMCLAARRLSIASDPNSRELLALISLSVNLPAAFVRRLPLLLVPSSSLHLPCQAMDAGFTFVHGAWKSRCQVFQVYLQQLSH